MKILAIEKEVAGVRPQDFIGKLKQEESLKVWELYQAGIIREIYFHQNLNTAVLILECHDEQEAEKFLGTLPLVRAKLITFEVVPLVPYSGFNRLFAEKYQVD
jgi:hypothetical protein